MGERSRSDVVVILAGGDSRRMGRPKGLCRHGDDPRPLLARVVATYDGTDWPVIVACTSALAGVYATVDLPPDVRWALRPPGGGTAATTAAAVILLDGEATHLWLHPVDLPFVRPATLRTLKARSVERPDVVLTPHREGRPGHPVVLPSALWPPDAGPDDPRAMKDLIAASCGSPLSVDVDDPGVVRDLDRPEDLDDEGED